MNRRTFRKRDESGQAAAGDSLYRAAIAASPDAFVALDADGRIVEWSVRAESMFGWPADAVRGKVLADIVMPEPFAAEHRARLDLLKEQGRAGKADAPRRISARRRDGDSFTAELLVSPVLIDGLWRFICFIRDLTEAVLAERQLIQAQKLEAIGHLTGGLAHDFNNILGIIIGSLDLVAPGVRGEQERELIAAALSAAHRGADVTRALLAVARRRALKPQPTDVNRVIDDLAPLLRQTAGKRVEVAFSPNAIDPCCDIDAGGLNNALVNLVINARDAMPDGGRILVYAYSIDILPRSLMAPLELKPGPYLVVGVDDSGIGMPSEVAVHAFDPFFTTKERGRGTGLGLAMVYGFARQSGGTAWIQSAPGRGTSVQLLLPVVEAPAALPAAADVAPSVTPRRQGRVLLVDDEAALLRIGREWLAMRGHVVATAASAAEALARLAAERFDLLVTDVVMPGEMDGIALARQCRRLYPEMPVLLTSGYAERPGQAIEAGCGLLDKPYTRATLTGAVERGLSV